jgi:sulfite exporter TauE/SafE
MTELLAGLALGLAGSLHCAVMCGPLVAALHGGLAPGALTGGAQAEGLARRTSSSARLRWWSLVLMHHAGRSVTYGALGLAAGLAGGALTAGGLGRLLSVLAGGLLLAMALGRIRSVPDGPFRRLGVRVSRRLAIVRQSASLGPMSLSALTGPLHALLPCGLVYAALAAAAALGRPLHAALFMIAFGAATTPVLLVLSRSLSALTRSRRPGALRWTAPAVLALVGVLLIWRGMAPPAVHASHDASRHELHSAQP